MSFLNLESKTFVVFGVANRKSVAYEIACGLTQEGAKVIHVVQDSERQETARKILPEDTEIHICNVENEEEIRSVAKSIGENHPKIHGLVHSIAYANFEDGMKPFHETKKLHFLQTMDVSCFSLISICDAFQMYLDEKASVITISISTTEMTAESYGWMAPAKAALNSTVAFLAKSFSRFSQVRFNALCPGLLKTSASAGIPGYIDNYLYAEKCTLRGKALETKEVANTGLFLLSDASSGINAQHIVIDAGMRINYFDKNIIETVSRT